MFIRPLIHIVAVAMLVISTGCYAPLRSPGIAASCLPDSFRVPYRQHSMSVNYASLSLPAVDEYVLGRDDIIRVEISDLVPKTVRLPQRQTGNQPINLDRGPSSHSSEVRITAKGDVVLPLVGPVVVTGLTLSGCRTAIIDAYKSGVVDDPRVTVSIVAKSTKSVMVLGEVNRPDVYELPSDQNDIAHALSRAGGMTSNAADEIQVHRNRSSVRVGEPNVELVNDYGDADTIYCAHDLPFTRIPLRSSFPLTLSPEQVALHDGDVLVVPHRTDEVFFVVGKLNENNVVRFSVGRDNRDLGNGFVLPNDRDVDVVTAVAMAGYIDPIDSPTTVTVHRNHEDGTPMLIRVDLIAARFDRNENIMVMPGDIIYLNPDPSWWFRRTFDRIIPDLITLPYQRSILKAFGQTRQ